MAGVTAAERHKAGIDSWRVAETRDLRRDKLRVCMISEGCYPHHRGGVGTWADMLIRGLPDVDFSLVSLVDSPSAKVAYELPDNVTELVTVPLWGISGALELKRGLSLGEVFSARRPTPEHITESCFVPMLEQWLELMWAREPDPGEAVQVLRAMRAYFQFYDYDTTMRSRPVWRCFASICPRGYEQIDVLRQPPERVSLHDLTDAMRLLYRWLAVLTVRIPDADVVHATAAGLTGLLGILASEDPDVGFVLSEHGIYLRETLLALSRSKLSRFGQLFQGTVHAAPHRGELLVRRPHHTLFGLQPPLGTTERRITVGYPDGPQRCGRGSIPAARGGAFGGYSSYGRLAGAHRSAQGCRDPDPGRGSGM